MKVTQTLFAILFLLGSSAAFSQENYVYVSWNYQVPTSNTNWLKEASPHGMMAGYRFFVRDSELSVGLDLGWTTFDQYQPTQTFTRPDGAITTDYYRYVYNYSGVISGQYYFSVGDQEKFFPYAGLGLGANYNEYTVYYNIYNDSYNGWGFLARPEAGILYRFSTRRSIGAIAAIHYDYSTNRNTEFNYSNFTAAGFKLGIVLMGR